MSDRLLHAEMMRCTRDLGPCSDATTRLACAVSVVAAALDPAARFGLPEIKLPERVGSDPTRAALFVTFDVGMHGHGLYHSKPRHVCRIYA